MAPKGGAKKAKKVRPASWMTRQKPRTQNWLARTGKRARFGGIGRAARYRGATDEAPTSPPRARYPDTS